MKRAGALVGVVVMVVAAFLVRDAVTGDDASDDRRGSPIDASVVLRCASELTEACDATGLDGVSTMAGVTADALVAATDADALDAEAWIVPAAWAHLVIDERARLGRAPLFEIAGDPLASTGIVLAIWADRDAELTATCTEVDWRCLAEQDGATLANGDRVRATGPPADTAGGLSIAAAQLGSIIGRPDFAANDFDGNVLALADRLARNQSADPLRTMRSRGPGQVTAAGVLTVDAIDLSSSFGSIVPRFDEAVRVDVVAVVPVGTSLDGDRRAALTEALVSAGWDQPATGPDGLPGGSVLAAVRTLWNEAR